MPIPNVAEKWSNSVVEVTLGATAEEGGTRSHVVKTGGAGCIPFIESDGKVGNAPVIAMEIQDAAPKDWPEDLAAPFQDVWEDPATWAKKCVEKFGADLICLKLRALHPDEDDYPAEKAAEIVKKVLETVSVPLIVWGSDDAAKDNQAWPKISQAAKGERCLLGTAAQDNYKILTAVCHADGHNLIGESPLDINICKQVNVLISDMEFPLDRIVIFPATGALGYGIEYSYSIQERGRIAALTGDRMMAMPVICNVGAEVWRCKEAKASDAEAPDWGPRAERGPIWEAVTAVTLLQAGGDILVMRHPKAVEAVKKVITQLMPV